MPAILMIWSNYARRSIVTQAAAGPRLRRAEEWPPTPSGLKSEASAAALMSSACGVVLAGDRPRCTPSSTSLRDLTEPWFNNDAGTEDVAPTTSFILELHVVSRRESHHHRPAARPDEVSRPLPDFFGPSQFLTRRGVCLVCEDHSHADRPEHQVCGRAGSATASPPGRPLPRPAPGLPAPPAPTRRACGCHSPPPCTPPRRA